MMAENLRALRFALVLMDGGSARMARCAGEDSEEVLRALAAMRRRSEHARHAFVRGTSQHTLQHNRIAALRAAETLVKAAQGS